MEEKLTVREAAQVSDFSESWWRQRIMKHEVMHIRVGGKVFVPKSEVEKFTANAVIASNSNYVGRRPIKR